MLEKILIGLLIVMLPATILISRYYLKDADSGGLSKEKQAQLDAIIAQLKESTEKRTAAPAEGPEITITQVFYASQSETLQVSGVAPQSNIKMLVSVVEVPREQAKPTPKPTKKVSSDSGEINEGDEVGIEESPESETVLGQAVQVKAIQVSGDGVFVFEYPVTTVETKSLELRFEQAKSSKTVIYNMDSKNFEQL